MAVFLSELRSASISQRAGWQLERMMGYEMEILDKGHYTTADFRASTDGRTYLITITHLRNYEGSGITEFNIRID